MPAAFLLKVLYGDLMESRGEDADSNQLTTPGLNLPLRAWAKAAAKTQKAPSRASIWFVHYRLL